jgi:hypothetical protein
VSRQKVTERITVSIPKKAHPFYKSKKLELEIQLTAKKGPFWLIFIKEKPTTRFSPNNGIANTSTSLS